MNKKEVFTCANCGKKFIDKDQLFFYEVMVACPACQKTIAETDNQLEREYIKEVRK